MTIRKQFHKEHTSLKIKIIQRISLGLILFMFIVVIHDSFIHDLPFYYILFFLAGHIIGHFISKIQKVSVKQDENIFTIKASIAGTILALALLGIRFFAGKLLLDGLNVIWTSDAIYLFFIGIYYSKIINIMRQIDEDVYTRLFEDK